ncbi:MAG TPA: D-hexose-6-phosphate mutarotase [Candidatus Aquilonibacter sp.]|nr:D-hexose-6-phosphate mutarotase [Candidatus Aquilonibacter sp.]
MSTKSVELTTGHGGLPLVKIRTPWSAAEICLHGAHVTHFQKNGEPPLLFVSAKSHFATSEAIRGGVPICFPWFGPRDGGPAHGLARILSWDLAETSVANNGSVTVRLRLPKENLTSEWSALRTEFVVTVADTLTMELVATNESAGKTLEIENCLHTYFRVGDITQVSIAGLQGLPFDDFALGTTGARKLENDAALRITKETNRVYPDATGAVEIRDENLKRIIRVEKSNSKSTVVWNPWTTQKLPDDFDPPEYRKMVCVESGNVKQNKISLNPGEPKSLKVILSSAPLK